MAIQYVEARKMDTNFRKLNCMWSLWYGVIIGSLQIYLIVQNVWKFVRFAELPWPNQQTPTTELNIFIGLNGLAVLLLPFFITACFLKIGNLANDNEMLGKRLRCSGTLNGGLGPLGRRNTWLSLWAHFGPISSLLHIICSVCLLFPQTLVDGVLIRNGFLPKDDIWKSDLDFLEPSEDDMVIRPIGEENGFSDFVKKVTPKAGGLRLEFVNYALALFIFSIRYAQVFWASHKKFAVVMGLHQILNSAHTLVSFSTMIVLYKLHVARIYQASTPFLLDADMTLLIFGIALTVLFSSSAVLYYLGYMKFNAYLQEKVFDKGNFSGDSSVYSGSWAYFPHSAAVSIALALAAAQSPLVHDAFVTYQISTQRILLAFPVSSVTYFLLWAILWLGLTLARGWKFDVTATIVQPVQGLETTGLSSQITIDIKENPKSPGPFSPSLVVITEGKAFSVEDSEDQKSILALIPKANKDEGWRKVQTPTPASSCLSYKQSKDHSKIKYMPCRKEVTFEDEELVSPRYYSRPPSRADKSGGNKTAECTYAHAEDFDSGDYAFLRGRESSLRMSMSSARGRESLYGHLKPVTFMDLDRNQMGLSPVSTVDSSSGVSSISGQSHSQLGPPSTSASCSEEEPKAHYEPVSRALSRRNSVRSYVIQSQQDQQVYQQRLVDEVYGKLRQGKGQEVKKESIYAVTSRINEQVRLQKALYGELSPRVNMNVNVNLVDSEKEGMKCYDLEDNLIAPPIPPPLPILSCVVRKSLSNSDEIQVI